MPEPTERDERFAGQWSEVAVHLPDGEVIPPAVSAEFADFTAEELAAADRAWDRIAGEDTDR